MKKYKQDEQDKFGSNQDSIIEDKLRKNNTKTSFFQAKEVFLRKYDDDSLTNVLNKNASFINEMLLSCTIDQKPCVRLMTKNSNFEIFLAKINSKLLRTQKNSNFFNLVNLISVLSNENFSFFNNLVNLSIFFHYYDFDFLHYYFTIELMALFSS